jgi:Zn finger protein HypA/HybF involved in hydrogenase expression
MNIYKTDIRPSMFDPKKLIARCPKCQNILVMDEDHVICDKCGEEIFVVEED